MENYNYNLIKILLGKLDDVWRIKRYYLKDTEEVDCNKCKEILNQIVKSEEKQIKLLQEELAEHIKEEKFK